MNVYIVTIIFTLFFASLAWRAKKSYERSNKKQTKLLYIIFAFCSFLFPFCISAFRAYTVGTDTSTTYYKIYVNIMNNIKVRDFGYGYINRIALIFSKNYTSVLFATSLIFCGFSFIAIFKESKNPIMSCLLFFTTNVFFVSMNMTRQALATSIYIFSIRYIKEKKMIRYFIMMFLAFSIHSSSILYFFMYFIVKKKITPKMIIGASLLVGILSNLLVSIVINLLYEISYFRKYFSWYITSSYNTGNISIISLLIAICIMIFLILIYNKAKDNKNYNILLWNQTIVVCLLLLSGKIPLMQRTSWLFSFVIFIYLPEMLEYISNKKYRIIIKYSINIAYILYMVGTTFIKGYNEVIPYSSVLFS